MNLIRYSNDTASKEVNSLDLKDWVEQNYKELDEELFSFILKNYCTYEYSKKCGIYNDSELYRIIKNENIDCDRDIAAYLYEIINKEEIYSFIYNKIKDKYKVSDENKLKKDIESYFDYFWNFNGSDLGFEFYKDILTKISKIKMKQLEEIDDKPGDIHKIPELNNVDILNRDKPFALLNNKFYVGEKGESHSQMMQKYYDLNRDLGDIYRPREKELENLEIKEYVWGSISGNLAFIDVDISNGDIEKCIKELKKLNIEKIYTNRRKNKEVKRLAKLIKKFK